ncbi:MAG TPA: Rad52/Rad22 family DNA repair protein [Alphaproteobacteria bacterium]|nr:Rad52/Rad22 family DNA repair protein [Alphaproteobacteria bacterium]
MIDIKALTAPFPPDRVSWRVGSTTQDKRRGLALAYIDARDVMERLDRVCGPENWQSRYPHATGKTVCEIGIKIGNDWIWKADGAGDTDFEADKGALSDAFKRAAVRWGIGRYLYDIEAIWVDIEPAGRSYRIAPHEMPRLRAALGKGKAPTAAIGPQTPAAAAKAKGFHLLNPETGKVSVYDRGASFLEALETAMRNGNPSDWWGANGTTARHVATLHPQALKRVEQLEELAMAPAA